MPGRFTNRRIVPFLGFSFCKHVLTVSSPQVLQGAEMEREGAQTSFVVVGSFTVLKMGLFHASLVVSHLGCRSPGTWGSVRCILCPHCKLPDQESPLSRKQDCHLMPACISGFFALKLRGSGPFSPKWSVLSFQDRKRNILFLLKTPTPVAFSKLKTASDATMTWYG